MLAIKQIKLRSRSQIEVVILSTSLHPSTCTQKWTDWLKLCQWHCYTDCIWISLCPGQPRLTRQAAQDASWWWVRMMANIESMQCTYAEWLVRDMHAHIPHRLRHAMLNACCVLCTASILIIVILQVGAQHSKNHGRAAAKWLQQNPVRIIRIIRIEGHPSMKPIRLIECPSCFILNPSVTCTHCACFMNAGRTIRPWLCS